MTSYKALSQIFYITVFIVILLFVSLFDAKYLSWHYYHITLQNIINIIAVMLIIYILLLKSRQYFKREKR